MDSEKQIDPLRGAWWLTAIMYAWQHSGRALCLIGIHEKVHGLRHSWCARGCGWGETHA